MSRNIGEDEVEGLSYPIDAADGKVNALPLSKLSKQDDEELVKGD